MKTKNWINNKSNFFIFLEEFALLPIKLYNIPEQTGENYMKVITISKKKFQELPLLDLSNTIFNSEAKIYDFKYRGERKVLKNLHHLEGSRFANKLYTLEMLDTNQEYLPHCFYIPDSLVSVNGTISGFTVPFVKGVNLSTILTDHNFSSKEQIYFLKKIGEILEQLKNIRKYTPLNCIYLNDLHDSNFIVNPSNKELNVIDLDSCRIGTNSPFAARFLTPLSLANVNPKYKVTTETESGGYMEADENTDIYCYIMVILNYLYQGHVNRFNLNEFYNYLNYLEQIGIDKNLIQSFEKITYNCSNENPLPYLDTLTEKNVYQAQSTEYKKLIKRVE